MLFLQEKDRSFKLRVAFQTLNRLTILNKFYLQLIGESFEKATGVKCFTRLNLKNRYNLIQIAVGDQ